ncbi:hypothetical protein [Chitinophaga sp.]|uniref:hypothetical protein n=1 Tax=Chitinophaga sp. TaxID=1869181 RepID=UPI0031D0C085
MKKAIVQPSCLSSTTIENLKDTYPSVEEAQKPLWELLVAAMGSQHADMWNGMDRANLLLYYELLSDLISNIYNSNS